ncbi:MAG: hypothetical protein WDN06_00735 [Asticcacaulis sp.]
MAAESTPDVGSKFWLDLPFDAEAKAPPKARGRGCRRRGTFPTMPCASCCCRTTACARRSCATRWSASATSA